MYIKKMLLVLYRKKNIIKIYSRKGRMGHFGPNLCPKMMHLNTLGCTLMNFSKVLEYRVILRDKKGRAVTIPIGYTHCLFFFLVFKF